MTIYISKIQLEDGIVEMPQRTHYSEALADLKLLNETYKTISCGKAYIRTY
jgi:hypothetical protein